ncbi:MAG: phytase [Desulfotignum sp.]
MGGHGLVKPDSPAFWKGDDGEYWLLATAKTGNAIVIYDARTGEFIKRFKGRKGNIARPNGIFVKDNLLLITERDNGRVNILTLPDLKHVGYVGEEELKYPYGITIDHFNDYYHMYITDNYEMEISDDRPPVDKLGETLHYFTFSIENDKLVESNHVKAFGDTKGKGVLHKVESLLIDRPYNRLLVADEQERNIKIYNLDGEFTGEIISNNFFNYEPEGIDMFECEDNSGYYIFTDQHPKDNCFRVFDRKSISYIGSFGGEITSNTDGIVLTQEAVGDDYPYGVFYPVHDDGSVTAIDWADIASALDIRKSCQQ